MSATTGVPVSGMPGSLETSLSHRCRSISTSQITPSPSESCGMVFRGREQPGDGATGPRSSGSAMSTLTGHDALCAISGDACVLRVSRLRSDDRSPAARPREAVSGPLAPDDPHLPPTVFPLSESHQGRVVNKVRMRFVGGSFAGACTLSSRMSWAVPDAVPHTGQFDEGSVTERSAIAEPSGGARGIRSRSTTGPVRWTIGTACSSERPTPTVPDIDLRAAFRCTPRRSSGNPESLSISPHRGWPGSALLANQGQPQSRVIV